MKTILGLRLLMFLYLPVLDAISAPVNFTILSHNFNHILQWSPGINSPTQTVFNLKQKYSNGKSITHLNIRNTTVDVSQSLKNIYRRCTFSVWASLDNMTSSKVEISITPYEDTVIGPPTVLLSGCGDCLKINVSLPRGSGEKSELDQFYRSVSFNISWKKAGEEKVNHVIEHSGEYVLQNLKPHDKYCIRVLPKINSNRNIRLSAWQCEYTSIKDSKQVLYLVSWSLGAVLFGSGVLVLVSSLFYSGFLCRKKTHLPKALCDIVQVYYLNPEWTGIEKIDLTRDSPLSNVGQGSHKKQHKDEDNFGQKADREDDEEYDEEDGEGKCTYMGGIIKQSGLQSTSDEENCIISALPLPYSSSICHTGDETSLHLSVNTLSPDIHSDEDEDEYKEKVMSKVSGENNKLPKFRFKPERNADVSNATGNVNLFSVTLRPFGQEEYDKDLDEEEVCKPLLSTVQKELYGIRPSVQTEIKTDDLITTVSQKHLLVCSYDPDIQTNQDTMSGYTETTTGGMQEQHSCSSEETDNCDTGYIMR